MLARKIIRICADDSPNVKLAREEISRGLKPSGRIIVPGVLEWHELVHRRKTWDPKRQAVGLDAIFYSGAEIKLFPPEWLDMAAERARRIYGQPRFGGYRTIGIDPAEGGDKSAWAVSDRKGLIKLESLKTPDTTFVFDHTIHLMSEYDVEPEHVVFDRGGGGKEHADRLRKAGWDVRTVAFGEPPTLEPKRGIRFFSEKVEIKEDRYAYRNRRAEMYGELSLVLDPMGSGAEDVECWAIPGPEAGAVFSELRRQLKVFPRDYDEEGRLVLPPKNPKPEDRDNDKPRKKSLFSMLGRSPDEADAVVLSLHALLHELPYSEVFAGSVG